jgi:acyl carrier protein
MNHLRDEIRQYILTEFLPGEKAANLRGDTPLRTSGILDSVATIRLVTFVEEHCGIELQAYDTGIENFDSIDGIVSLVESKKGSAKAD